MSIVLNLYKQSLISRKNDMELQILRNNSGRMNFLGTHQGKKLDDPIPTSFENKIDLENIMASTELLAINSELEALNCSLNYLA